MTYTTTGYLEQTSDITVELAQLVTSGLAEGQIARLSRLRAAYARIYGRPDDTPTTFSCVEHQRLVFYRWLYSNRRRED